MDFPPKEQFDQLSKDLADYAENNNYELFILVAENDNSKASIEYYNKYLLSERGDFCVLNRLIEGEDIAYIDEMIAYLKQKRKELKPTLAPKQKQYAK